MSDIIPNWDEDLIAEESRDRYLDLHAKAMKDLNLI
jgi:hypothetical protein